MTVLLSCHGGSGSTLLATSAGVLLAQAGQSVCLLDLDLQFGDALTVLGLKPRFPISEAIGELAAQHEDTLYRRMPRHPSGLCVMSQVGHVRAIGACTPKRLARLALWLMQRFQFVIVDGVRDFNDHALALLDHASDVLLVAMPHATALRGLTVRNDLLRQLNVKAARQRHVVLSRYRRRHGHAAAAVTRHLGFHPLLIVREDNRAVDQALGQGQSVSDVAPHARISRDMRTLVETRFAVPLPPPPQNLLRQLLSWRPR